MPDSPLDANVAPAKARRFAAFAAAQAAPHAWGEVDLSVLEDKRRRLDDERRERHAEQAKAAGACDAFVPSQIVVADAAVETIAEAVSGNPRGLIQWRDEPSAWLGQLGDADNDGGERAQWLAGWAAGAVTIERGARKLPLHLERFPGSIPGTIQPDPLKEAFHEDATGLASRLLYTW